MKPPSSPQTHLVAQLDLPEGWDVLVDARVAAGWLGAIHAPLAVLSPGPGGPGAHRTQLVVFVASDATPAAGEGDHGLALAAAAGIPEAWRIDETRGWTEVFRAPWDGRYRSRTLCLPGEAIVPLACTRLRVVPISLRCAR